MKPFIKPLIIFALSLVAFWWILFWDTKEGHQDDTASQPTSERRGQKITSSLKTQLFEIHQVPTLWNEEKKKVELTIAVPEVLLNYQFQKFFESFEKEGIQITVRSYQDFSEIQTDLSSNLFDLVLLPYDMKGDTYLSFWFQEDLSPFFRKEVQSLVKDEKSDFLPFALDLLGFFVYDHRFDSFTFSSLWKYLLDWEPVREGTLPFWFWLTSGNLRNWGTLSTSVSLFWSEFLKMIETYHDDKTLEMWMNLNINTSVPYTDTLVDTISSFVKKFDHCKYAVNECALMYRFVDIVPWFYSTNLFFKEHFVNKKETLKKIRFFLVPFSSVYEPLRVWWWSIPANTEHKQEVYRILEEYMKLSNERTYDLRNQYLVPAFSGQNFPNTLYSDGLSTKLIERSHFLEEHQNDIPLRQLLDYQISSKVYLGLEE